ncbi:MAG: hypothetical protein CVU39_22900 [Chloroflexi bacterium HGW-Chloroflexi-10]|nr:MAG: hypothetical protein CVU39_22900 [Chloroflexi bacterium HGW-Chloroflexi-10]
MVSWIISDGRVLVVVGEMTAAVGCSVAGAGVDGCVVGVTVACNSAGVRVGGSAIGAVMDGWVVDVAVPVG